jgi:thiosulfate/3-mercaptopyruvate sulfurtransferase
MDARLLVGTGALANALGQDDVVVFDCRHDLSNPGAGRVAYAAGHIVGAHFLDVDEDLCGRPNGRNGRHPLPARAAIAARLGAFGVGPTTQVVGYDASGGIYAARLWWTLRWLGHPRVAVLDGGWNAWCAEGRPVTTAASVPRPAALEAGHGDSVVRADEIVATLGSDRLLVIDARSPDRFRGENETIDPVGGRIPGAVNRFFQGNLDPDGRFCAPEALRAAFAAVIGRTPVPQVVHQCGSGITAAHNLLAMEVAGLHGSRLYAGSWSEWCSDPARPVARGPA